MALFLHHAVFVFITLKQQQSESHWERCGWFLNNAYICSVWSLLHRLSLLIYLNLALSDLFCIFLEFLYLNFLNCLGLVYLTHFCFVWLILNYSKFSEFTYNDLLCFVWHVLFCQFCALYSLLVHYLIYSKFSSFALSNLFLHCLTYSVFPEFVLSNHFKLSGFVLSEILFLLCLTYCKFSEFT